MKNHVREQGKVQQHDIIDFNVLRKVLRKRTFRRVRLQEENRGQKSQSYF